MSQFYPLKVKKVEKLTPESVSVVLEIPAELKEKFAFKPGQFVMVEKDLNGEKLRRYYSIYSVPEEGDIKLGIKLKGKDGFADYAMHRLKPGETLEVSIPMDDVKIDLAPGNKKKYLAVTIGSGITPFYSIIREKINKEPESRLVLVYGNKTPELAMFLKELRELEKKYPEQFKMYEVYSESEAGDFPGRIDEEILKQILSAEGTGFDAVYLIGPDDLKKKAAKLLTETGIPKEKLHYRVYT